MRAACTSAFSVAQFEMPVIVDDILSVVANGCRAIARVVDVLNVDRKAQFDLALLRQRHFARRSCTAYVGFSCVDNAFVVASDAHGSFSAFNPNLRAKCDAVSHRRSRMSLTFLFVFSRSMIRNGIPFACDVTSGAMVRNTAVFVCSPMTWRPPRAQCIVLRPDEPLALDTHTQSHLCT